MLFVITKHGEELKNNLVKFWCKMFYEICILLEKYSTEWNQ